MLSRRGENVPSHMPRSSWGRVKISWRFANNANMPQRRQMKNYLSTCLPFHLKDLRQIVLSIRINFIYVSNYCNTYICIYIYHNINYIYLSIYLSIHLFIYPSVQLCIFSIHATHRDSPIHPSICPSIHLILPLKNEWYRCIQAANARGFCTVSVLRWMILPTQNLGGTPNHPSHGWPWLSIETHNLGIPPVHPPSPYKI